MIITSINLNILLIISFYGCKSVEFPVVKGEGDWAYMINKTGFTFEWKKPENDQITMQLSVNHLGWMGFGFCKPRIKGKLNSGKMQDCDLALAWIDNTGTPYVCDTWASTNGQPERDSQQDYTVISGATANGRTTIKFKRNMNTDDSKDVNLHHPALFSWAHHYQAKNIKFTDCILEKHDSSVIFDEFAILIGDALRHDYSASNVIRSFNLVVIFMLAVLISFV